MNPNGIFANQQESQIGEEEKKAKSLVVEPKKLGMFNVKNLDEEEEKKKSAPKPTVKKLASADDGGF